MLSCARVFFKLTGTKVDYLYYFMHMNIFLYIYIYIYLYRVNAWSSWRPEECGRSPETEVTDGGEPPYGCLKLNLGSL